MISCSRRLAVAVLFLLSGCAPEVNGHYSGYVSALFGFVRTRVILTVNGETAILRWSNGARMTLHATRHRDRLVLADSRGDTLTFRIADQGETLRCAQCRAVQLPETWERQVREPPTGAAVQPKTHSQQPAHCTAEPARHPPLRVVRTSRQYTSLTVIPSHG